MGNSISPLKEMCEISDSLYESVVVKKDYNIFPSTIRELLNMFLVDGIHIIPSKQIGKKTKNGHLYDGHSKCILYRNLLAIGQLDINVDNSLVDGDFTIDLFNGISESSNYKIKGSYNKGEYDDMYISDGKEKIYNADFQEISNVFNVEILKSCHDGKNFKTFDDIIMEKINPPPYS